MSTDNSKQVATAIAAQLGEPQVQLVQKVVRHVGVEQAQALLQETLRIEAEGGLLIENGKRRRTLGGVFLYLVKEYLDPEERQRLFPPVDWRERRQRKKQKQARGGAQRHQPAALPFDWAARGPIIEALLQDKLLGRADTVKLTLIGRPGKLVEQNGFVLTTMRATRQAPPLPKGLPTPPQSNLLYLVYIASKQWRKVAEALVDPADVLIVEGYLTFDPELKKLSVFAQNVTTKQLQRARRQAAP